MRMFQRRHYKVLAQIIRKSNSKAEIIQRLIEYFQRDNPLFDRERFLKACSF